MKQKPYEYWSSPDARSARPRQPHPLFSNHATQARASTDLGKTAGAQAPFRGAEHLRVGAGTVEASGIEADSCQREITIEHLSGSISTFENPADVADRAPKCAIARGVVTQSSEAYELSNVVETALARALVLAAEAGRWDVSCRSRRSWDGAVRGRLGSKELQDSQHGVDVDAAPVANDLGVLG